jgi:AraC-like DNA-binding protein
MTQPSDVIWAGWERLSPVLRYANFYDGAPGSGFGPRYIQDFQILFVQAGTGTGSVGHETFDLAPGDLVFYGPNVVHRVLSSRTDPLKLVGLHFLFYQADLHRLDPAAPHGSAIRYRYRHGQLRRPLSPNLPAKLSSSLNSPLRRACESLVLAHLADPIGRPLEKRGLLLLLFQHWQDAINHSCTAHRLTAPQRQWVEQAQAKLLHGLRKPPDLADLARPAGISQAYFARLFKRHTGLSLRAFVTHHRLLWARRLLVEGRLNVSEVADAIGFDDPFYFSRRFREQFGAAPSVFRARRQLP